MGTSISHPIFVALNELLRSKGLKLKRSTLANFLEQVDITAPWFANTGQLTVLSWEKLGRDLDFAWEQGMLKPGVHSIWRLVRGCLEDKRCSEAVEQGQAALDSLQEERSEKANSEKIYPSLKELEETEDEEELQALIKQLERTKVKRIKGKQEKPEFKRSLALENETPSAPPPYNMTEGDGGGGGEGASHCPQVWREVGSELRLACPVFLDSQGQRYHEPLDFKTIKALAELVRTYGVTASFTVALVESLARLCMDV
ncbi:hypothetical protein NN561_015663 [Cricetulus griseus]